MSQKNHAPDQVPANNRFNPKDEYELPEQDESGRTEGPKDKTGLDQSQDEERQLGRSASKGEPPR